MHADLHEKPVMSWNGKKYSLMCVEHVSKYSMVYFLTYKSDAFEYCLIFIAWVERRTGTKMLAVQADGGGEFTGELFVWCKHNGLTFQKTSRATPEENGVAEAYNKVNHQTAEVMKFEAKQANKFWPERESHGCLVDTWIVKAGESISAYEMIHQIRPSCELLRVYGCHSFAYIPISDKNRRGDKMCDHMRPGIYMGISPNMNGYNLYDPVGMKFFETTTAVFDEDAVGATALIERMSGPPSNIPAEWIAALNKEWEEKYKGTTLATNKDWYLQPGQNLDANSGLELVPIERIDPKSPVSDSKVPEISNGSDMDDVPKFMTPQKQQKTLRSPADEQRPKAKRRITFEDTPMTPPTPTPVTPEARTPKHRIPQTPVLKLPPPKNTTPVLNIPMRGTPDVTKVSFVPSKEKPKAQPRIPSPPTVRVSERLRGPGKAVNYSDKYFSMIERKQDEILHIMEQHSTPNQILKNAQYIMAVEDDSISSQTPRSFNQMKKCKECEQWWCSMGREMTAHHVNGTWRLVPRPKPGQGGKKHVIIRGIWKYRIKTQQNLVTSYKSRLCADGRFVFATAQEVFAGTPIQDIVFLVFAIAAHYNVQVESGDVPAAYVQAKMPKGDTIYYMEQPPGFKDEEHPDYICELLKCLYGLPQSGHQWNEEFANFLVKELGMRRLRCDPSAFIKWDDDGFFLLVVTVDDTIDVCTSPSLRKRIHESLKTKYKWKHIGVCDWHLGMRITQNMEKITIDQTAYLNTILDRFEKFPIHKTDSPMKDILEPPVDGIPVTDFPYQSIVGCLIWMTKTRYDISYSVSKVAQYMSNHTEVQDRAVLQILGYLRKHPNWGVGFTCNTGSCEDPIDLRFASDSSWADCLPNRESSYGVMSFFNGDCFQCKSSKTPGVCHDVHQAEYHAIFKAGGQFKFLSQLFDEMGLKIRRPVPLQTDSNAAIATLGSNRVTQRSKHMDMRCHATRELLEEERIYAEKVASADNRSDVCTKPYAPHEMTAMRPQILSKVQE
jgi:hypothetical protein